MNLHPMILPLLSVAAGVVVSTVAWRFLSSPTRSSAASDSSLPPGRRRAAVIIGIMAIPAAVGLVVDSPSVAVAGPIAVAMVASEARRREQARQQDAIDEQLPALVDAMIQQLRSGLGLHGVCRHPPSVGPAVDRMAAPMVSALVRARPLVEAVTCFGSVDPDPTGEASRNRGGFDDGTKLVATALTVVADRGGPAVPALQRLRLTLTGLAQGRAEARARASQALASARLLMLAPAAFAVLLAAVDPRLSRLYVHQPVGAACVTAALALTYVGWRWMNRLVAAVVPSSGSSPAGRDQ